MGYYRDLREFAAELERRGKLHRFPEPIDKDTELGPLLRVQLRGLPDAQRKVLLFENVRNAHGAAYEMKVLAGVYGLSEEIVALGMGCETPGEMFDRWHRALERPIPPVIVDSGPVQEEVHVGEELLDCGLDELPAPLEEVGFSQMIRTGTPMITRDPESGITNVGTYNAFFRDRNRICAGIAAVNHAMRYHWQTARRRGEDLPVAIVNGCTPNVMYVGCVGIPYGINELEVAGAIAGEPVELVRCKTVPLEVPSNAEIVIEGYLSTETFEPRLGFGEYPGYMAVERNQVPMMRVTAITHRKNALFTPVLVGFPPSDSNVISSFTEAATAYHYLRYACQLPIEEVYFPDVAPATFGVVRLQKGANRHVWQVLQATAALAFAAKYVIAVDYDVDPRDRDLLFWALTWRVRPETDIVVMRGRRPGLDPSFAATGSSRGHIDLGGPSNYFRVLVDATMSGAYPPLALPRKEYMDRALEIWKRHEDLPEPRMHMPWYGYENGYWSDRDQQMADLMVRGDYKAVGRIAREMQVSVESVLGNG
jgi:4-hydroxy-3-polyprenylbenzoate decarboxylase